MSTWEQSGGIAVVGLALRFPGATTPEQFWQNLVAGRDTTTRFSDSQLAAAGVDARTRQDPHYVPVRGVLDDIELFDAEVFGMSAREAAITDPQHRLLLECAAEALEHAGHCDGAARAAGVFAGAGFNAYLVNHVLADRALVESVGLLSVVLGNEKDHLATRIAHRLDLRGPAVTVQTACSTSLVAVHMAAQSLLSGETDLALAGGVTVAVPQEMGHLHTAQGVLSADGRCRAFDRAATGTVEGNGAGLVVLKRVTDALTDGDTIHAVIVGSAVNNDGAARVGYTAPSVAGQADVIRRAHAAAAVDPSEVDYVETHGTGTEVGDAIEVAALIDAFRGQAGRVEPCLLGSVKPSIGHLDTASGIANLIKVVLALGDGRIPASLHCTEPNPDIPFEDGPFAVNTRLRAWPQTGRRRTAAVSSFGMGGTNVHVVIRQAPPEAAEPSGRAPAERTVVLPVAARTADRLETLTRRLLRRLTAEPAPNPADAARTLQHGRPSRLQHRRTIVWPGS